MTTGHFTLARSGRERGSTSRADGESLSAGHMKSFSWTMLQRTGASICSRASRKPIRDSKSCNCAATSVRQPRSLPVSTKPRET
jgi:hypothetical protein